MEMTTLTYIIFAAIAVVFFVLGWFVKHKFLQWKIKKSTKELAERDAQILNLEHEIESSRQKVFESDSIRKKLEEAEKSAAAEKSRVEELLQRINTLEHETAQLTEQNQKLSEQIDGLRNDTSQIEELFAENSRLKKRLASLKEQSEAQKKQRKETLLLTKENETLRAEIKRLKSLLQSQDAIPGKTPPGKEKSKEISGAANLQGKRGAESQSTEKFGKRKKKSAPKQKKKLHSDTASTGIRMLEAFAEELRNPKN